MTLRVLVVDDEPDVEPLFRQQFRREVREGLYLLDFASRAERTRSATQGKGAPTRAAGVHDLGQCQRRYGGHGAGTRR